MLTLRLQCEADGVAVAEEAVDDGEADEGDAARDAHGARRGPAGVVARGGALGVRVARRAAPPPARRLVPAALAGQERGAQLLHLRLKALRAPKHAHASARAGAPADPLPSGHRTAPLPLDRWAGRPRCWWSGSRVFSRRVGWVRAGAGADGGVDK